MKAATLSKKELERARRISGAVIDRIPPSAPHHPAFFSVESLLKLWPSHVSDVDHGDLKRSKLAIPLTTIYILLFLGSLVATFYVTLQNTIGKQFLSLDGSNNFQNCEMQPQPITSKFSADFLGRWSTNPSYTSNNTIYELSFFGSLISDNQFRSTMEGFRRELYELGVRSSRRDFVWSAVAWSTFRAHNRETGMTLLTNAMPNIVLDDLTTKSDVYANRCLVKPVISMTSDSTKIDIEYDIRWPVVTGQLNLDRLVNTSVQNLAVMKFVKAKLMKNDMTNCDTVCRALKSSDNDVPLSCKSGIDYSQYAQNPSFKSNCPTPQKTVQYTAGPIIISNNRTCIIPTGPTPQTMCDAISNSSISSSVIKLASDLSTKNSDSTFEVLCPCGPAYTEPCAELWNIKKDFLFNAERAKNPNIFPVRLDTRSIFLATAVNFGIVSTKTLMKVTNRRIDTIFQAWSGSKWPSINYFIDPEFAHMTPIICLNKQWIQALGGPELPIYPEFCLVSNEGYAGNTRITLGFPIMSGTNSLYNSCKCDNGGGNKAECNNLNTTLHVLWFRDADRGYIDMLRSLTALTFQALRHGKEGDIFISDMFYAASILQSKKNSTNNPLCPGSKCFLMSINLYKNELTRFLSINENEIDFSLLSNETYSFSSKFLLDSGFEELPNTPFPPFLSLQKITCVNTIYQSVAMDHLATKPPMDLNLPYYKCTTSVSAAYLGSFGSAAGSTGLLSSAVFAIILYLVLMCVNNDKICNYANAEVDGLVLSSARHRIDTRLAHVEELLETLTEVAVTNSHNGPAFQSLIKLFETKQIVDSAKNARPTSFDLASAYCDDGINGQSAASGAYLGDCEMTASKNPIVPNAKHLRLSPY
jgi:hypothetical protein